ncbi:hypothetical protein ACQX07_12000 [Corynebacterium diphtheriae]
MEFHEAGSVRNRSEKKELRAVLAIIDSEVNRQLSDHIRSATSLNNRAALLVTSSLIFVSIPKNGDGIAVGTDWL